MAKNMYKGLTATAITLALAGAAFSIPALAEDTDEQQPASSVVPGSTTETTTTNEDGSTTTVKTEVSEENTFATKPTEGTVTATTPIYNASGEEIGSTTTTVETIITGENTETVTETETTVQETTTTDPETTEVENPSSVTGALGSSDLSTYDWNNLTKDTILTIDDKTYTVTENTTDNGVHTITLTNTTSSSAPLTAAELKALLNLDDAVELSGENGSYTYTLDGKEYTVSLTASAGETGTLTTTTTLTMTVTENTETITGSGDVQTNTVGSITDAAGSTVSAQDALTLASKDGVTVEQDANGNITSIVDGSVTYTFTYTPAEGTTDISTLTTKELYALLDSTAYTLSDDEQTITDSEGHVLTFAEAQNILQSVTVSVTKTDAQGDTSDSIATGTTESAAKQQAAEAAAKNALIAAAQKAGLTLTADEIDLTAVSNNQWSVTKDGQTYTFALTVSDSTTGDTTEWTAEQIAASNIENIASGSTTAVNGSATVTGSTIVWSDSLTASTTESFIQSGAVVTPTGATGVQTDDQGRVTGYTITENGTTTTYTFTYSTLTDEEKAALLPSTDSDTSASLTSDTLTKISWTIATSATTTTDVNETASTGAQIIENNGTYTYTDGTTTVTLTKVEGKDNTYVAAGNSNVTYTVSTTDATAAEIKAALEANGYANVKVDNNLVATYTDENNNTVTLNCSGQTTQTITIQTTNPNAYYYAGTDKDKLIAQITALIQNADGEEIYLNGIKIDETTIESLATWIEAGSVVNFDAMTKEELVTLLEQYEKDAVSSGNSQSNLAHIDLDVGATLVLTDGTTTDCVLLSSGLSLKYNTSANQIVDGSGTSANIQSTISYDSGSGYYEYKNNGNLSSGTSSQFYQVTGTVAYGTAAGYDGIYSTEAAAKAALEKYKTTLSAEELEKLDAVVVAYSNSQDNSGWGWGWSSSTTSGYRIYLYQASLTAYGYMTKESNTCAMQNSSRPGYDLTLDTLTMLENGKVVASSQSVTTTTYSATLTSVTTSTKTGTTLKVNSRSVTNTTESTGSALIGSYTVGYQQTNAYTDEDVVTGTGTSSFNTYKTWVETTSTGTATGVQYTGSLAYTYEVPTDPTIEITQTVDTTRTVDADLTVSTTETTYTYVTETTVTETIYPTEDDTPVVEPSDPTIEEPVPDLSTIDRPTVDQPTIDIPDEDTPLAPAPDETISDEVIDDIIDEVIEEINEETVPLVPIMEDEIPLTSVPQTGTRSTLPTAVLSAAVAALLLKKRRRAK